MCISKPTCQDCVLQSKNYRIVELIKCNYFQGPLPETFGDLWRMLWEQRSSTIVMMTKLEERTRIKCDQYWPARVAATETYGIMHVTLTEVQELATFTLRTFQLQKVQENNI